jgi:plastocyanin
MGGALWVIRQPRGFLLQFALLVGGVRVRSLFALVAVALAVPAAAGTITGRVELVDKPGRRGDISEVVVYIDDVKVKPRPATASVVMKGKAFSPHVVAVPVGGTVEFPNEDPIFHNAFSVSGPNKFDLALYKRPKTGAQTFLHPGVVKVYCNIHPQMSAVVVVVDSPYFTKVGSDGTFTVENVPAGKHVLKAWHERAGDAAVEVTVPERGAATAALRLDATTWKRVQHKNKFGKDYSGDEKY